MTEAGTRQPGAGWPFWAPSDGDAVTAALDLAALGTGERFVDLGCGDGRVLVEAAARGARVTGIECDAALAADARRRLADAGVDGTVLEADIFDADLDADVLFTYLSPATLQRLMPALATVPAGSRLVTVDFELPGVVADGTDGRAHCYVAPFRRSAPSEAGWRSAGALVVALPGYESLTCLDPAHPGGAVTVAVGGGLAELASVAVGADRLARGERLAVDLRWGEHDAGTVGWGWIDIDGLPRFPVFVVFDDAEGGLWELSREAVDRLADHFAGGVPAATGEGLLGVALDE